MNITYTWELVGLDRAPSITIGGVEYTDVIQRVHWWLHGTDGTHTGVTKGETLLDTSAIDSGSFVAFDQLSPDTIASWAKVVMDVAEPGRVDALKASVADEIAAKANPSTVSGLPSGMATEVADSEVSL